ncbi:MAG: hypothetical protein E6J90_12310 [Deltaproteobacteria bacterium]|nr:MAG: hypothetical protein E6J91_32590 [Deltaproteobacteria bacterium]TMQ22505.1 MAG: hypothetical protein E6J90_12310 [Deltaproteobacteria bacterium]
MVAPDLRFIILGEDHAHVNFVRRWLLSEGVGARQIMPRKVAAGATGDGGEKYVRQQFPAEVQYYRAKANHQRIALIVAIDADLDSVARRQRQLDETLDGSSRQPTERIALVVPRRNIETWLAILLSPNTDVDEDTDFKHRFRDRAAEACANAGPCFAEFLRRRPQPGDLPSLTAVRAEIARLT